MAVMADTPQSLAQASKPRPLSSLTASAARLKKGNLKRFSKPQGASDWQQEVIELYHLVGEQRFLSNTLGNRIGQARIFVVRLPDNPMDDPIPLVRPDPRAEQGEGDGDGGEERPELTPDELRALDVWEAFGSNPVQLSDILTRAGINLFNTGDGWLVGVPKSLLDPQNKAPGSAGTPGSLIPSGVPLRPVDRAAASAPTGTADGLSIEGLSLDDLQWRFLSVNECKPQASGDKVQLHLQERDGQVIEVDPEEVFIIRIWRSDPFEWWQADSPARSSLSILRVLVGLAMGESADLDSRLTGPGLFLVPQTATDAIKQQANNPEAADDWDPVMEALMEVMQAARENQDSAAARVPLAMTVPDESIEKFRRITFWSEYDATRREDTKAAIQRLALGEDCPPELLLGVGNMNHWGAWLVQEDTVVTHVEPPVGIFCDAMTTEFFWPVLDSMGVDEQVSRRYAIWYSTEHMIVRPNQFSNAKDVYDAGELSGAALRREGGFGDDDAPQTTDTDEAVSLVIDMLKQAPTLAQTPGIPVLVEQVKQVLAGEDPSEASGSPGGTETPAGGSEGQERPPGDTEGGPPATAGDDADPSGPPGQATAASGLTAQQVVDAFRADGAEAAQFIDGLISQAGRWGDGELANDH